MLRLIISSAYEIKEPLRSSEEGEFTPAVSNLGNTKHQLTKKDGITASLVESKIHYLAILKCLAMTSTNV